MMDSQSVSVARVYSLDERRRVAVEVSQAERLRLTHFYSGAGVLHLPNGVAGSVTFEAMLECTQEMAKLMGVRVTAEKIKK